VKTIVLNEAGYDQAVQGFALSYNSTIERAIELLPIYAFKGDGENKFLESIMLWLGIQAPRYWWQEADTYRVGVSKQSESTMHTLSKRLLTQNDFERPLESATLDNLNYRIKCYNEQTNPTIRNSYFESLKNSLPEGFLQHRIWLLSYKTLQNIYKQRANHRLSEWKGFLITVVTQIEHPEFIIGAKQEK
jgi:hypothetical protein